MLSPAASPTKPPSAATSMALTKQRLGVVAYQQQRAEKKRSRGSIDSLDTETQAHAKAKDDSSAGADTRRKPVLDNQGRQTGQVYATDEEACKFLGFESDDHLFSPKIEGKEEETKIKIDPKSEPPIITNSSQELENV